MTKRNMIACAASLFLAELAACAASPSLHRLRAEDSGGGTGQQRAYPRGIIASMPPADSSFTPLRCVLHGPDTECSRN